MKRSIGGGTDRCPRARRLRGLPDFGHRSKEVSHMIQPSLSEAVCVRMVAATLPGAQTERRGGAGPVRDLLGGKALPAALFFCPRSVGEKPSVGLSLRSGSGYSFLPA